MKKFVIATPSGAYYAGRVSRDAFVSDSLERARRFDQRGDAELMAIRVGGKVVEVEE